MKKLIYSILILISAAGHADWVEREDLKAEFERLIGNGRDPLSSRGVNPELLVQHEEYLLSRGFAVAGTKLYLSSTSPDWKCGERQEPCEGFNFRYEKRMKGGAESRYLIAEGTLFVFAKAPRLRFEEGGDDLLLESQGIAKNPGPLFPPQEL